MYNNNKKIPHAEKESLFLKYLNIRKSINITDLIFADMVDC